MASPQVPAQGVTMLKELLKLKHSPITTRVNYIKIPCTAYQMNDEGARNFNKVYNWIKEQQFNKIIRTPSGGISIERRNFKPPMWDVRATKSLIEITIVIKEGCWRIQFRTIPKSTDSGNTLYGSTSFKLFSQKCLEYGIDLNDYIIDNGAEVKEQIESPIIKLERPIYAHKTYDNVHHLDFHSSYPTGLINTHPEFKEPITWMYEHRKEDNNKYKLVLNATIGYMQSLDCCDAKWAHLSRDAIKDNNDRIRYMADKLRQSGRVIIAYNTDGIWYKGDVYHDENEGKNLGQWENDHINCIFRAKSAGSYEYLENGIYHPVVRGQTKMDTIKKRDDWQWGDIYQENAAPLIYKWTAEGIMRDGKIL